MRMVGQTTTATSFTPENMFWVAPALEISRERDMEAEMMQRLTPLIEGGARERAICMQETKREKDPREMRRKRRMKSGGIEWESGRAM
jgi:hypothetical protein